MSGEREANKGKKLLSTLRSRMVLSFGALFAVTIIAVEVAYLYGIPFTPFHGEYKNKEMEMFKDLREMADMKKEHLMRWLEERRDDAEVLSESRLVRSSITNLKTVIEETSGAGITGEKLWARVREEKSYGDLTHHLNNFLSIYEVYYAVWIIDPQTGTIIASTDEADLGLNHKTHEDNADILDTDARGTSIGYHLHGDTFHLEISRHVNAVTTRNRGEVEHLALLKIHTETEDITGPLLHTGEGLGETGEVTLLNQNAQILTPLKHPLLDGTRAEPFQFRMTARPALLAAEGNEGILTVKDYRGVPVLAAYRYVPLTATLGWGMVVKKDREEVFAPLKDLILVSTTISIVSIALVLWLTLMIAKKLSGPIALLSSTAKKIEAGDFHSRAQVTSPDEVGEFARTFNSMIDKIQKWHEELDVKVKTRTAELSEVNLELKKEVSERKRAEEKSLEALNEARVRSEETMALLKGAQAVLTMRTFPETAKSIFDACKNLVGAPDGYGAIISDDGTENIIIFMEAQKFSATADRSLSMPIRGMCAEVYQAGKTLYDNVLDQSDWKRYLSEKHIYVDNVLFAPLMIQKEPVGLFALANKPGGFTDNDERIATAFADLAAIALYNNRLLDSLQESEENYRNLVDNALTGVFKSTLKGEVLYVNEALFRLSEYESPEELIRQGTISRYKHPEDRVLFLEILKKEGKVNNFEVELVTKTGKTVNALVNATLEGDTISGMILDITESRRTMEAYQKSEKRFRDLVESSLTGILIVQDEMIVYKNPEQERLFGDFKAPMQLRELVGVHEEDRERFFAMFQRMASGDQNMVEGEFRYYFQNKSERRRYLRWIYCRASAIEFQGRGATLVNVMDITRSRELEMVIEDKMTSLGRVAAGIAHEIRNPLSGINIYLKTLKNLLERGERDKNVTEVISQIRSASNKIESVIRRALDFSKPGEIRFGLIDINQPIDEAINLSAVSIRKSGIEIEKDLDLELPSCYADKRLIEQVVLNLISNSADAMANVDGPRKIKVSTSLENNSILLRISDSGPGVPEDLRDRIFEPFFTTKSENTGLGLSISNRIIADHGGHIDIFRSDWGGAEFALSIPRERRKKPR